MVANRAYSGLPILSGIIVFIIVAPFYYIRPINPDIAVYDYIGLIVNQGGKLYLDAADQNWPGQMLIHVVSVALFGSDLQAYRTFELLFILPFSCLIIGLALRQIYSRAAAFISIPIYIAMYTTADNWSDGQREAVAGPLLVGAALMLYLRVTGHGRRVLLGMAALMFVAMLIRPTLLIIAPLLAIADVVAMRSTRRNLAVILWDHSLAAAIIILLALGTALIAHLYGVLDDWFEISILFNLQVYSGSKSAAEILWTLLTYAMQSWHWIILWSTIGAFALWKKSPVALIFFGAIAPATLISVLAQGKGFIYHAVVIYPLFALLIAIAVAAALQYFSDKNREAYLRVAALVVFCIPLLGLTKRAWSSFSPQYAVIMGKISKLDMYDQYTAGELVTVGDAVRAADYINTQKTTDTKILVWGRSCHIYNLTGITSPLFAASFALLDEATPEFERFDKWQQRLEDTFHNAPPEFLLLVKNPDKDGYRHFHKDAQSARLSDVIERALPRYQHERAFANLHVFRLVN